MAEIGAPYTLSTDTYDIVFNDLTSGSATYLMQEVAGLDGVPVRTVIEDAPQTDGALILGTGFDEARHITLRGVLDQGTGGVTARNLLEDALIAACHEIRVPNSGSLVYQPTGQASRTYTVFCDVQPTFPGTGVLKEFIFGLVAANASYS